MYAKMRIAKGLVPDGYSNQSNLLTRFKMAELHCSATPNKCKDCGACLCGYSKTKKRCESCNLINARKRASEHYARKRLLQLKDNPENKFPCNSCGVLIARKSSGHKRCGECARLRSLEKARARERQKMNDDCYRVAVRKRANEWKEKNRSHVNAQAREYWRSRNPVRNLSPVDKAEKKRQNRRKWYEKNKDLVLEKNKSYRTSESGKASARKYRANRESVDHVFKICRRLRARINHAITNASAKKNNKSYVYLGMTGKEFIEYIVSHPAMKPDFTLGNYGKVWVIDHIRPVASFDLSLESERMEAFNYRNCQPLSKDQNLLKGSFWNGYWWKDGKPYSSLSATK